MNKIFRLLSGFCVIAIVSVYNESLSASTDSLQSNESSEVAAPQKKSGGFLSGLKSLGSAVKGASKSLATSTGSKISQGFKAEKEKVTQAVKSEKDKVTQGITDLTGSIEKTVSLETKAKIDPLFVDMEKLERTKFIDAGGEGKEVDSKLTDEDVVYLVEKLNALSALGIEKITLNLSNNAMTTKGFALLLDALKKNTKLVAVLDVSGNKIGDDGAVLLAEYLPSLAMMSFVLMSNTAITGSGALAIISSIAKRDDSTLQMLDLSRNAVSNDYWNLIVEQVNSLKAGVLTDGIDLSENKLNIPDGIEVPKIVKLVP